MAKRSLANADADSDETVPFACGMPLKKGLCQHECATCFPRSVASDPRAMTMWSSRNTIDPRFVTKASHKKMWWTCPKCQHEWDAVTYIITSKKSGCPFWPCCDKSRRLCGHINCEICKSRSVAGNTRAMTMYSNKNTLPPICIAQWSHENIWWKCTKCNHQWDAPPKKVIGQNQGCPFPPCCKQTRRLCYDNNCVACLRKSVAGNTHAMQLWSNDNPTNPRDVAVNSSGLYKWKCPKCNYIWKTSPDSISGKQSGCHLCVSSISEQHVHELLESENAQFIRQWVHATNPIKDKYPLPFDFLVSKWENNTTPFLFEPDGIQHFNTASHGQAAFDINRQHDLMKMRYALEHGGPVVRMLSSTIRLQDDWHVWLRRVVRTHIAPLKQHDTCEARRLIVLEDNRTYRAFYAECLKDDPALGPHVVFA